MNDADPFVRTTDKNGLTEDRYFERFFGVYKTKKLVQHMPDGPQVVAQYNYNRLGHLTESIDANGLVTQYETDGFNRIKKVTEQGAGILRETIIGWNKECEEPSLITTVGQKKHVFSFDSECRITSESIEEL